MRTCSMCMQSVIRPKVNDFFARMASSTCNVVLVGDSFIKDGDTCTWAMQLTSQLKHKVHNFAEPGTTSADLSAQAEKALSHLEAHVCPVRIHVAIIGGGGNDLLRNLEATMDENNMALLAEICENKRRALKLLLEKGVRHVVVTAVPFTTCVPCIKEQIQDYAAIKNVDFDSARGLASKRQHTLIDNMSEMLKILHRDYPDMTHVLFDEAKVIETWDAEGNFFDSTKLHPNEAGHVKLAEALLAQLPLDFPKGSVEDSSVTQAKNAPSTPQVVSCLPAGLTETPPNPSRIEPLSPCDSLDEQFESAANAVRQLSGVTEEQKLTFYGLYKQATQGDNTDEEPPFHRFKEKAKWNAWHKMKGTTPNDAKVQYIRAYERFTSMRRRT